MTYFKNKVIWITGASSGIGEALALALAPHNPFLVLSARREDELERVKKATSLPPDRVLILPLDLAQYDHFEVLAQQVAAKFGRIDILVNNGGISQRSYFKDTQFSVLRQLMETNFMGNVALTKAVLPHMIEQGGGSIAVVSSVTGKFGTPLRTFYAASKHALHGFYDALRAEMHDDKIHVLMVCPGYIKTNLSYHALLGDGSPQNRLDPGQASGISAHDCALAIMKGLKGKKREIYPAGAKELLGVFLSRFFPGILAKMVRKVNVR